MQRPTRHVWEPLAPTTPIVPLSSDTRPALTPHVRFETDENGAVQQIRLVTEIATLDEEGSVLLTKLLPHMDGKKTLTQIASSTGEKLDIVRATIQDLFHMGVVYDTSYQDVQALSYFYHIAAAGKLAFKTLVKKSPLHDSLKGTPPPTPRLMLGKLVEEYHFVDSAASHISPAIAQSPNTRLRAMYSSYLEEEFWHGTRLREGLIAAQLSSEEIENADPLPETLAMINCLRIASHTDILTYSACLSLGENEGKEAAEDAAKRYEVFRSYNLLPEVAYEPFCEHEIADAELGHAAFCAEAFVDAGTLTAQHQKRIYRATFLYVQAYKSHSDRIFEFYKASEGPRVFTVDCV